MHLKSVFFKFFLSIFLSAGLELVHAQQNNIDSIIYTLEQSKTAKGIDTTIFGGALQMIERTAFDEASISRLENAGSKLSDGASEYWSYGVKLSIVSNLILTDKAKALQYGKLQIKALENSKTPNASYIRSSFLKQLRLPYRNSNMLMEGFAYFNEKLKAYKLNNDSAGLADCYYVLSGFYRTIGLLDQSIYNMKKSVSYMSADENIDAGNGLFTNPVGRFTRLNNISVIGIYHLQKGDYEEAIEYARIFFDVQYKGDLNLKMPLHTPTLIAEAKLLSGQLDSVMYYLNISLNSDLNKNAPDFIAYALQIKALYKIETGALDEVDAILAQCWQLTNENNLQAAARPGTIAPDYYYALLSIKQGQTDEAIAFLIKDISRVEGQRLFVMRDYKLLANLYEQTGRYKNANEAFKAFNLLQDSLKADQSKFSSLSFEIEQEMNEKELSISKLESKSKIADLTRNFTIGIAVLLSLLAGVIYYRFQSKKKANLVLEKTLAELKAAQAQLVQSEKMASLGELTAGIAHEIQNPLNFVNNFSDVNTELIDELKQELAEGNMDEVKLLIEDIKGNEIKINHHGKRAGAIVKGMLQHSTTTSGQKEPTDLNALCHEYLRLAYHGMKAKNKNFAAFFQFEPDTALPKVNVIPQDMGRVLLNLINNAFQACGNDEFRMRNAELMPQVKVSAKNQGNKIEIRVKDNGPGIPDGIKDKIFQPFFTTKPTGQGTGLGLSLSYDIVKAHGGQITVETKEGEGSTFIIQLPC